MDEHGIKPESLKQILSKWNPDDVLLPGSSVPKLLFCSPHCQNPTGSLIPLDRRSEIYKVHIFRQIGGVTVQKIIH